MDLTLAVLKPIGNLNSMPTIPAVWYTFHPVKDTYRVIGQVASHMMEGIDKAFFFLNLYHLAFFAIFLYSVKLIHATITILYDHSTQASSESTLSGLGIYRMSGFK